MKKRVPLVLALIVLVLGFALGKWQSFLEDPSTLAILESREWHEEDARGDGRATFNFDNGKMRIDYIEEDGSQEELRIPYRQTDQGTLLFDQKALKRLDKSAYFFGLPEEAKTMELVILHPDDKAGTPADLYVGWKFFSHRNYLITLYSSELRSKK